jgi:hypothetical protein
VREPEKRPLADTPSFEAVTTAQQLRRLIPITTARVDDGGDVSPPLLRSAETPREYRRTQESFNKPDLSNQEEFNDVTEFEAAEYPGGRAKSPARPSHH